MGGQGLRRAEPGSPRTLAHPAAHGIARTAPRPAAAAAGGPARRGSGRPPPSAGESLRQARLPAAHPLKGQASRGAGAGWAQPGGPTGAVGEGEKPSRTRWAPSPFRPESASAPPVEAALLPGRSGQGPGWSLGHQSPGGVTPAPQPYLPLRLGACFSSPARLRQEAVVSPGRGQEIIGLSRLHPPPSTPTQPVGRGRRRPDEPPAGPQEGSAGLQHGQQPLPEDDGQDAYRPADSHGLHS